MNRTQKEEVVSTVQERLGTAAVTVLAEFHGLSSNQLNTLRKEVRQANGEYRVVKNTLSRRVVGEGMSETIADWLQGPTAIVFGFEDPLPVTKVVAKWAGAEPEKFSIKGGFFEGATLASTDVVALSKTPPMDVLRAQLLGLLQAPASRLARVLAEPGASLARALGARKDSMPGE